ncbi:hypothetical protein [Flavobacterium nitrogenifigens]|uniref:YcxB-like protein n=1 Tax=Flavobacterium nitrogenifigens TaxID=1617283 RepID=A0A521BTT1_9FLAO|nr:hypothetical protein [Flavobacterium nitrogenifigens]KAF2337633.1 hypothetical protein DM397_04060 [Flavobacterium nitrogenifigens]SMO50111.1 hypothetical protein SAMN06265220_1011360 [Flavobacterium nitrogenifigens]
MKFEIAFDKDVYNKQMDLLFDLAWKRKKDYYKNTQYLGVVLMIIGVLLIFNRPNVFGAGYFFLFFGLSNLLPFVYYFFKIKNEYKKLGDAKIKEIEILNDSMNSSFELSDDSLIITIQEKSKIINWNEFVTFVIKDESLILITKDYMPYILDEIEVGKENFQKIISFVEKKIEIV